MGLAERAASPRGLGLRHDVLEPGRHIHLQRLIAPDEAVLLRAEGLRMKGLPLGPSSGLGRPTRVEGLVLTSSLLYFGLFL